MENRTNTGWCHFLRLFFAVRWFDGALLYTYRYFMKIVPTFLRQLTLPLNSLYIYFVVFSYSPIVSSYNWQQSIIIIVIVVV